MYRKVLNTGERHGLNSVCFWNEAWNAYFSLPQLTWAPVKKEKNSHFFLLLSSFSPVTFPNSQGKGSAFLSQIQVILIIRECQSLDISVVRKEYDPFYVNVTHALKCHAVLFTDNFFCLCDLFSSLKKHLLSPYCASYSVEDTK